MRVACALALATLSGCVAHEELGDRAAAVGDWSAASVEYKQALDREPGSANLQTKLRRAEVRPYSIQLRSLLVKPVKPDGTPWAGKPNELLANIAAGAVGGVAAYFSLGAAAPIVAGATRGALTIPEENRPNLHIEVALPDGSKLKTPNREDSMYLVLESRLVIASNHFDDRVLGLRVYNTRDHTDDVGVIDVRLGDLIEKKESILSNQSIAELQVVARPVDGEVDGAYADLEPIIDPSNEAKTVSA